MTSRVLRKVLGTVKRADRRNLNSEYSSERQMRPEEAHGSLARG
jgi:hypothetical protein